METERTKKKDRESVSVIKDAAERGATSGDHFVHEEKSAR